jgi:multiple antibiotic resistance protein
MIDHIFIAQCQRKNPLPDQCPDGVLNQFRRAAVGKTLGKPIDQPDRPVRRSQQQGPGIRGHLSLLLGSLLVGSYVLEFFGITLPVLRIAGGFVVTMFGWTLLRAGEELGDQRAAEASRGPDTSPDAFYPLTMPLTVGPGAISVAIALGSQRPKEATDFAHLAMLAGVAIAGLGAVAVTIYICYRFAKPTIAALGKHGTNVVVRLSAFLLLCIGIQIVWTGFSELQIPSVAPH